MKEMKILLCPLFFLVAGVQFAQAQDQSDNKYKKPAVKCLRKRILSGKFK